jgi:hypothetical protein
MITAAMGKKGQIVALDEDVINDPSSIRLVGFPLPNVELEKEDSEGNMIPAKAIPTKLSSILVGNAFIRGWLSIYTHEGASWSKLLSCLWTNIYRRSGSTRH